MIQQGPSDAVVTLVELIIQLNDRLRASEHKVRELQEAAKEHKCPDQQSQSE